MPRRKYEIAAPQPKIAVRERVFWRLPTPHVSKSNERAAARHSNEVEFSASTIFL